jgi:hypothetical protein
MDQEHRYRYAAEDQPWNDADAKDAWRWVPRGLVIAGIGLGALAWWLGDANAQTPPCGPLGNLEAHLKEQYKETRIGFGIVNSTTVILFYSTPDGKTFTIVSVNAQGIACLVSSGTDLDLDTIKPGRGV